MEHTKRFAAYAAAFEKAYVDNNWTEVATFFAENAVYDIGLPILGRERVEGRDEIIDWFKDVLDRFDRRFAGRELHLLEGPREEGDTVWIGGYATYSADGVPSFDLHLNESIRDENGLIVHLRDHYQADMTERVVSYVTRYGDALGILR
jgi:hypothetical protein